MTPDMADKSQDMGGQLIRQVLLDMLVALLAALVVLRIRQRSVLQTAAVLLLLGLTANGLKELSDWNWYGFSLPYALVNTIDHGIQWFLLGALLAWLARKYSGSITAVGTSPDSAGFTPR